MSTESNKNAIQGFRNAFNAGDLAAAMAVFAPNAVIHMAGSPEPLSREAFEQFGRVFVSAFPDGKSTVEDIVAEGDKVVTRLTYRGTHTADLMGIPPTGKLVTVTEIIVDRLADGKIVESWRLFDQMAMMQQLGVIPVPGQ